MGSRIPLQPLKYCDLGHMHFHVFLPTFPCFFQNAIKEIYNKDASISIYLNFFLFISVQCHRVAEFKHFLLSVDVYPARAVVHMIHMRIGYRKISEDSLRASSLD